MGRFYKKSSRRDMAEPTVNLTPLIDVVFVILIMFIVIAPLLEIDQIELADASQEAFDHVKNAQESSPITIYVHQDNTVWMNNQELTLAVLAENLKAAKQAFPQAKPQLFHDKRAFFGTYNQVKNTVEAAGFQEMEIILKPA